MSIKDIFAQEQQNKSLSEVLNDIQQPQNGIEERQALDTALARFAKVMSWKDKQTVQTWCENLLEHLVPFVEGLQGVIYYSHKQKLHFSGGFAIDDLSRIPPNYAFGEGLLGEVAKSQEVMVLNNQPNYASLASYSRVRLKCLIILPLIYNKNTVGVMEINFPQDPTPFHLYFLKVVAENIAANLNALVKEQALAQSLQTIQISEERLQRLAEVTTEGIAFLDESRRIVECNAAFNKIFGFRDEKEVLGKRLTDFLDISEEEKEQFEDLVSNDIPFESTALRPDASPIEIEIQERDIVYHNAFYHIISVRDITQRKEAESNLRSTEARLEEAQKVIELNEIIKKKNQNITASINYAKRIQEAFLPETQEIERHLPESFIFFRPKDIVSGDFYWFTQSEDKLVIAAVDCTGHGVPGAIMSMAGGLFLKQIVNLQQITAPDEILTQLHLNIKKALKQEETGNRDGMDAAICTIDKHNQTIAFAGAKNSLIYVQNGEFVEIKGDKMPVGGFWGNREESRIFHHKQVKIEDPQNTTFYLLSDGIEDQFGGEQGRKFMKKNLRNLLCDMYQKPMEAQKEQLTSIIDDWMQNGSEKQSQVDDMLMIGFRMP